MNEWTEIGDVAFFPEPGRRLRIKIAEQQSEATWAAAGVVAAVAYLQSWMIANIGEKKQADEMLIATRHTVNLMQAQPVYEGQVIPEVTITVTPGQLPGGTDLADVEAFYVKQARCLGKALAESLPQGTMHQLLVWVLQRYASLYVGPIPSEKETHVE